MHFETAGLPAQDKRLVAVPWGSETVIQVLFLHILAS